ncbi:hypothetical protein FACS1894161_1060 [Spirochaetia bacterium]|nr:hypothetical protein FACS1894161_1060 [Spirochaetia bacterium]
MIDLGFICEVLARFEGKAILRGYVPCIKGAWFPGDGDKGEALGCSGVTVGTGVDLGQQSVVLLRLMGLPEILIEKLAPYCGRYKAIAIAFLNNNPLVLSPEEARLLDEAVHKHFIKQTSVLFGRERFEAAPKEAQAVAVSLHYQFGTPRRSASPALEKAWNALREGNYGKAAAFLRNRELWGVAHKPYMSRREAEAALLEGMSN